MPPVLEATEAEEKAAAEKLAADEAQAIAEFNSGYADVAPTEVVTPSPEAVTKDAEALAAKAAEEKAATDALFAEQQTANAPKYVQVTEDQLRDLLSYNKTIEELRAAMESRFGSAFGKMGGLERSLKEMQAAAATGETPTVTEGDLEKDLEDLKQDFPDFTPRLAKSLAKTFGKLKGTKAAVTIAAPFDPETVKPMVVETVNSAWSQTRQKEEQEELAEAYVDWSTVIGQVNEKTEYRAWLATQPAPYQKTVGESWRAATVIKSLDNFYRFKAQDAATKATVVPKPIKAAVDRKAVLAEALNPRGEAGVETGKTAQQEFQEGFSGK